MTSRLKAEALMDEQIRSDFQATMRIAGMLKDSSADIGTETFTNCVPDSEANPASVHDGLHTTYAGAAAELKSEIENDSANIAKIAKTLALADLRAALGFESIQ
jgi:hypothetical protein